MASSKLTVGKSGYALGSKRSDEDWDKLFQTTILGKLQSDVSMTDLRATYGPSEKIRQAARRAGYATTADARRGNKSFTNIKVKGVAKKALAGRIAARRNDGASWNTLRLQTGLAKDELLALLKAHGHNGVTTGRVITSERGKAAQVKAAAKPVRKRTRKAKVAA